MAVYSWPKSGQSARDNGDGTWHVAVKEEKNGVINRAYSVNVPAGSTGDQIMDALASIIKPFRVSDEAGDLKIDKIKSNDLESKIAALP